MTHSNPSMRTGDTDLKRLARLCAVAAPAAGITTGLFFAMQNLITGEQIQAPDLIVYEVSPYVEQEAPEKPFPPSPRPIRQEPISPPPSPPNLVTSLTATDVPAHIYRGAAPADYGEAILEGLRPKGIGMVIDRTLQPISPPVPTYPRDAAREGLQGDCVVHLKVSSRGDPFAVDAECSHPAFEKEARRSIEKVRFAPQIRQGLPVTVTGVVYPLEFRLKQ